MNQSHEVLVRRALAAYLSRGVSGDAPPENIYLELARRHQLLPIFADWSGFVGLRDDGAMFWVSEDDGSVTSEIGEHARHLATILGPELFPELGFLAPIAAPDWIECWSCGGTGKVVLEGQAIGEVRCLCGGLGRLPPQLASLLRARLG